MFNRESILKSLNTENYYIDKHSLDLFLEDWKIESIYEDEDDVFCHKRDIEVLPAKAEKTYQLDISLIGY